MVKLWIRWFGESDMSQVSSGEHHELMIIKIVVFRSIVNLESMLLKA